MILAIHFQHQALITPNISEIVISELENLLITLASRLQPYGCCGVQIHATTLRRSVPFQSKRWRIWLTLVQRSLYILRNIYSMLHSWADSMSVAIAISPYLLLLSLPPVFHGRKVSSTRIFHLLAHLSLWILSHTYGPVPRKCAIMIRYGARVACRFADLKR